MIGKKPNCGGKQATTIIANDPGALKGVLKQIGGSPSDHWNSILATQAVQTLWIKHSNKDTCDEQYGATIAGLMGIGPKNEPIGNKNALRHGHYTAEAIALRRYLSEVIRQSRAILAELD